MAKLIILRGISGSGKSTWTAAYKANHPDEKVMVVNRDSIRALCFGSESDHGKDEAMVSAVQYAMLSYASRKDYTIIVDNTNIEPAHIRNIIDCVILDTEVQVVNMPLDLARAKMLNNQRERVVPEHVIEKQYARLLETKDWTP